MRWGLRFLVALVVALAVVPASALAAPANDDFANRQVLGPGFPAAEPVEVKGSNVEATKEAGESIPGLSPAGHSVWYEWEAASTGWTTVGVCEAGFPTIVGIFTGSKVDELTSVIGGNANTGKNPDCPSGQPQYTFRAEAGTKYEIAVDGNGFFVEPPPPVTEGEFTLRIEETPPPPNDDFADAIALESPIDEEPGGNRFYFVSADGYNWGATRETGEPGEESVSGASVWYRWTPPESGTYRFSQPGVGLERTVYSGNALDALTPVVLEGGEAFVTAGTTYYVAVSGEVDSGGGEPEMASFNFFISAQLPPLPKAPSPPPPPGPDVIAPQTTLVKSAIFVASRSAKFWFASSEAGGGFFCQLDKQPYKPCGPPRRYKHLKPGQHTFRVKAVDAAGNVDASPAVAHFKLPHPKSRHR